MGRRWISASSSPACRARPSRKKPGNEFYYDGVFHLFTPTADPRLAVKVLLAVEALHNLDDPVRRKACEDVRSAAE